AIAAGPVAAGSRCGPAAGLVDVVDAALVDGATDQVLEAGSPVAAIWLVGAVEVAVRAGGRAARGPGRGAGGGPRRGRSAQQVTRRQGRKAREGRFSRALEERAPVNGSGQVDANYPRCSFSHG